MDFGGVMDLTVDGDGRAGRDGATPGGGSREQLDAMVVEMIRCHAEGLLRLARQHSICADDANDAYQRGLEIYLRHAPRLDPARAPSWLRTVVKHEAMAVRKARQRDLGPAELEADAIEARNAPSPEERVVGSDEVERSAEALQRCKPQEVRALWLRAQGNSYDEIQEITGWTRTKVDALPLRGAPRVPRALRGDRVRGGVRALEAAALGARRRRGDAPTSCSSCARTCAAAARAARRCVSCTARRRRWPSSSRSPRSPS